MHANAAVRPTLFGWRRYEDDLSREYEVFDHGALDGVPGMALKPAPVELLGHAAKLDHQIIGEILRLDFATFLPP